ncbi:hypothetical protein D3C81_333790 [compost metagenome]
MGRLIKKASASFLNDHGIIVMNYVDEMIKQLIEVGAQKAAEEIGYTYDSSIDDLIYMNFESKLTLGPLVAIQDIYEALDEVIMEWQEDTMNNHME